VDDLIYFSNKTLHLILLLSAMPVAVATAVGLIVGLLQTVTQLQEQTLPFGLKLLAVCACLAATSEWFGAQLLAFARAAFSQAFDAL
jgi:type III secretion protein S